MPCKLLRIYSKGHANAWFFYVSNWYPSTLQWRPVRLILVIWQRNCELRSLVHLMCFSPLRHCSFDVQVIPLSQWRFLCFFEVISVIFGIFFAFKHSITSLSWTFYVLDLESNIFLRSSGSIQWKIAFRDQSNGTIPSSLGIVLISHCVISLLTGLFRSQNSGDLSIFFFF